MSKEMATLGRAQVPNTGGIAHTAPGANLYHQGKEVFCLTAEEAAKREKNMWRRFHRDGSCNGVNVSGVITD
jgi:hypothetical protein